MPTQNADSFRFRPERAENLKDMLINSIVDERVDIVLGKTSYAKLFAKIVKRYFEKKTKHKPCLSLFLSDDVMQMTQEASWILICDVLPDSISIDDLTGKREDLYDDLSIRFSQLRKSLATNDSINTDMYIDLWCCFISASLLTFIIHHFENTELYRNAPFTARIEKDCRKLFVGFASPNVREYHHAVLSMVPEQCVILLPTRIGIGGDSYNNELTSVLSYEPEMSKAWRSRNNTLFQDTEQTGLMKNAMKLRGTAGIPIPTKGHKFIQGNVERSSMPLTKTHKIIQHVDKIVDDHEKTKQTVLNQIFDTQYDYFYTDKKVAYKPSLGISFEAFGTDNKYRSSARSPSRVASMVPQQSCPQTARAYRQRHVLDIKDIQQTIKEANKYLMDNWI